MKIVCERHADLFRRIVEAQRVEKRAYSALQREEPKDRAAIKALDPYYGGSIAARHSVLLMINFNYQWDKGCGMCRPQINGYSPGQLEKFSLGSSIGRAPVS